MRVRAASAVALVLAAITMTARSALAEPPDLKKARAEFEDLRFEDAEATLSRTLKTGKNGPDDLVAIYMLGAEISSAKGDDAGTVAGFTRALALRPETPLPAGTSPKVAQQFAKARDWIDKNGALSVRYEGDPKKHVVRLTVKDKLRLVDEIEVFYTHEGAEGSVKAEGPSPMEVAVPSARELPITIVVRDANGNRLQELGSLKEPLIVATDGEPLVSSGGTAPRPRAWYAKWWLWGGVAVAVAGAGTYFGLDALAAEDDAKALIKRSQTEPVPYSELDDIETRGKRDALIANIGFITAGALAAFSVYLLVTDPGSEPEAAPEATTGFVPSVAPDQVGLTWSTTF
jgi:hypothetical protein